MGYYFISGVQQEHIKEANRAKIAGSIHRDQLTRFVIDKNSDNIDFSIEDESEINWKGVLYDVVNVETEGNSKVYYCLPDHEETNLITARNRHIEGQANTGTTNKKSISAKAIDDFEISTHPFIFNGWHIVKSLIGFRYAESLQSFSIDGSYPPPRPSC